MARLAFCSALLMLSLPAKADYVIYVANKDTAAYGNAVKVSDQKIVFTESRLHKALILAGQILNQCGRCGVQIKIAAGFYTGKADTSYWPVYPINSPRSRLRIIGGFNDTFSTRAPFSSPTVFDVNRKRPGALLHFVGKTTLKELTISGLTFNMENSNSYDDNNKALIRLNSINAPIIDFGNMNLNMLIISDNLFMNAPAGPITWNIKPTSRNSQVIVNNNMFLNNVYAWQVSTQPGKDKNIFAKYTVSNNSFILSWPAGASNLTDNPAALEIGPRNVASSVEIYSNLFAYNIGGAIHPLFEDAKGPKVMLSNNLFYKNGSLFTKNAEPDSGILTGKFNYSQKNLELDLAKIEDFYWDIKVNASFNPDIDITRELTANIKLLNPKLKPVEGTNFFIEDEFTVEDYAIDGEMKIYAVHMPYDATHLPFPYDSEAMKYGASEDKVMQF